MRLLWPGLAAVLLLVGCKPGWVGDNSAGNDLFRQGRLEEALVRYEAVVGSHPSAEASYNAGTALAALRRDQDAIKRLDSALEAASPTIGAAVHYNRGIVLFRLGDCGRARDAFVAALQLDPSDQDAGFNLAIVNGELAQGADRPGSVCQRDRTAGSQPSASEGQPDGEDSTAVQEGPQTSQDPRSPSQQMQDLLSQIQRGPGSLATELNSDHPNMSVEEALRLLEEARGRQGGFDIVLRGTSGAVQP